MGCSYHVKGIVESVKIKLEEESDSNVKERNISENINKGIVKSVNNKLNEELESNLKEEIPKNEIKGVIKGDNKNSDEEVNCFC